MPCDKLIMHVKDHSGCRKSLDRRCIVKDCQICQDFLRGMSRLKLRIFCLFVGLIYFFVCFLSRPLCISADSHLVFVSVSHCDTGSHVELEIFLGYRSSESMQHGSFNPIISLSLVT